jgi:hypothetical protein
MGTKTDLSGTRGKEFERPVRSALPLGLLQLLCDLHDAVRFELSIVRSDGQNWIFEQGKMWYALQAINRLWLDRFESKLRRLSKADKGQLSTKSWEENVPLFRTQPSAHSWKAAHPTFTVSSNQSITWHSMSRGFFISSHSLRSLCSVRYDEIVPPQDHKLAVCIWRYRSKLGAVPATLCDIYQLERVKATFTSVT